MSSYYLCLFTFIVPRRRAFAHLHLVTLLSLPVCLPRGCPIDNCRRFLAVTNRSAREYGPGGKKDSRLSISGSSLFHLWTSEKLQDDTLQRSVDSDPCQACHAAAELRTSPVRCQQSRPASPCLPPLLCTLVNRVGGQARNDMPAAKLA